MGCVGGVWGVCGDGGGGYSPPTLVKHQCVTGVIRFLITNVSACQYLAHKAATGPLKIHAIFHKNLTFIKALVPYNVHITGKHLKKECFYTQECLKCLN